MRARWIVGVVLVVLSGPVGLAAPPDARPPHRPHNPHKRRPPRPSPPPDDEGADDEPVNVHLEPAQAVTLPGRGLALAWAPDGHALAVGGHFKERATGLRYDTRVYDVARNALVRSYACHYFWVVATAWSDNPFLGPVIADGGGDHAVKLWDATSAGSTTCKPGQARATDGALGVLPRINGWITSLAFSPDGRWLAATSRDRAVRIWQLEPGKDQWRVVALWYDPGARQLLSVDWSPDGRALVTGDRRGTVTLWPFDPATDRWDDDTIAEFATVGFAEQPGWWKAHAAATTRVPRWSDPDHGTVWRARFSPDGSRVVAGGQDGVVSVLDAATGLPVWRAPAADETSLHGLDWSPDGRWIAAGAADQCIYVLDAADGSVVDTLVGHDDVVTAVAWSPDGRTLASTAGGPLLSAALASVVNGPDQSVRLWTWR